jgi:hypothetical protein
VKLDNQIIIFLFNELDFENTKSFHINGTHGTVKPG